MMHPKLPTKPNSARHSLVACLSAVMAIIPLASVADPELTGGGNPNPIALPENLSPWLARTLSESPGGANPTPQAAPVSAELPLGGNAAPDAEQAVSEFLRGGNPAAAFGVDAQEGDPSPESADSSDECTAQASDECDASGGYQPPALGELPPGTNPRGRVGAESQMGGSPYRYRQSFELPGGGNPMPEMRD